MFAKRLLTSLVFVPLVASAFHLGGLAFAVLLAGIALLGSSEYRTIMASANVPITWALSPVTVLVAVCGCILPSGFALALLLGGIVVVSSSLICTWSASSAIYSLAGEMYLGGLLGALGLLRSGPDGLRWAFFVLLSTWATDVGAYLGGTWLGRRKLAPQVSKNKTVEGALIGVIAASCVGWAASRVISFPTLFGLGAGIFLGALAILGDLFESSLKRFGNLKDSGSIIPGHGGVLDRFDSLLFTGVGGLLIQFLHEIWLEGGFL